MINLFTVQIVDGFVRENFQRVQNFLSGHPLMRGNFEFMELTLGAVTNHNVPHLLGFTPKDVITLSVSDSADVIWHYDNFTSDNIQVSTTKACTVRLYLGRHKEGN